MYPSSDVIEEKISLAMRKVSRPRYPECLLDVSGVFTFGAPLDKNGRTPASMCDWAVETRRAWAKGRAMSATTQQGKQAWREQVEREALGRIAARLAIQFPELAPDDIRYAIQGRYAEFDGSRIRDFVPVLVERSVKSDLQSR